MMKRRWWVKIISMKCRCWKNNKNNKMESTSVKEEKNSSIKKKKTKIIKDVEREKRNMNEWGVENAPPKVIIKKLTKLKRWNHIKSKTEFAHHSHFEPFSLMTKTYHINLFACIAFILWIYVTMLCCVVIQLWSI